MGIRLFPERFLDQDDCFGLFRLAADGSVELPVTIEGDGQTPIHIVHSDPEHLAYLAGLLALQAWVYGVDEREEPHTRRESILVITETPGRFAEAYLQLHIPVAGLKKLCSQRRVALWQKLQRATNPADKREYWDWAVADGDERTRLHNFFPAKQLLHENAKLKPIANRQHLGRGDTLGAAVIVARSAQGTSIKKLVDRFSPFMILVDADDIAIPRNGAESPTIIYHDSIFAPALTKTTDDQMRVHCLPDARFEQFCAQAKVQIIEPPESTELATAWGDADGAILALLQQSQSRRSGVIGDVTRTAMQLRTTLLGLPIGVTAYEQALLVGGLPEGFTFTHAVTEPLQTLVSRLPEVAAIGEWEEFLFSELLRAFRQLVELQQDSSPKHGPISTAIRETLDQGRRAALVVKAHTCTNAIQWILRWPSPLGFGFDPSQVSAVTPADLSHLLPDQDCVITHAFDPHEVLTSLSRLPPRSVTFILLRNELRFVGERLLRIRKLFPNHSAQQTILRPMCDQVERLPVATDPIRRSQLPTLFSDADFELVTGVFGKTSSLRDYDIVLGSDDGLEIDGTDTEVNAILVRLEGGRAVFLVADARTTYVDHDDEVATASVRVLEPGHRLIVIRPESREFIVAKIMDARRSQEANTPARLIVARWHQELNDGIAGNNLSYAELLKRIRAQGSDRLTPGVIRQWAAAEVLGPLDPQDLRRIADAIDSAWLRTNWKQVAASLTFLRTDHRLVGQRITKIIQRAAVGDAELTGPDEELLSQIGVSYGQLQDAVTVVCVESVSPEPRPIPGSRIGLIITV